MSCDIKHPLIRDGVSQKQRLTEALKPEYVKVDERSMEDLLYFLVNYSKEVAFFDTDNKLSDSWQTFLEKDITVIIAMIAKKDVSVEKNNFQLLIDRISDSTLTEAEVKKNFKTLFDLLFTIIFEFDKWYKTTSEGLGIQSYLKRVIRSQIKPELDRLLAYYKGALTVPKLFRVNSVPTILSGKYKLKDAKKILDDSLTDVWYESDIEGAGHTSWNDYMNSITANESVYGKEKSNPSFPASKKIRESLNNFTLSFNNLHAALLQVIQKAPVYMKETLQKYAGHEPHTGLLLSFLKLFKYAQDHLNSITKRHLDYYYEKVLRLSRMKAVPDKVHLIYKLAKHIETHKLKKDSLLKAGKDAAGNEVLYKTNEETIYNKASIASLKSIYIDKEDKWRIYASPVANSVDGKGGDFGDDDPKWKAFGESQKDFNAGSHTMPDAESGFAVCSPILLLNEGKRHILLKMECEENIRVSGNPILTVLPDELNDFLKKKYSAIFSRPKHDLSGLFKFALSSVKAWLTKSDPGITFLAFATGKILFVYLGLDQGLPAVTNYDVKLHGKGFNTAYPVLKLTANPANSSDHLYHLLKDAKLSSIKLDVIVNNVKSLVLQNDNGVVDPSKPFQPFTAQPAIGSRFYIGNHEIFKKSLNTLKIDIDWHNIPDSDLKKYYNYSEVPIDKITYDPANSSFKVNIEILENNDWKSLTASSSPESLFEDNAKVKKEITIETNEKPQNPESILSNNLKLKENPDLEKFSEFTVNSKHGFIRLTLKEPTHAFGHKLYAPLLTKQLVKQKEKIPVEPYTPEIKSISLSYASSEEIKLTTSEKFNKRTNRFYHILPFGTQEVHAKLTGNDQYVLSQFKHTNNKGEEVEHQGIFLIGIKDLEPPQNVSILFKVSEGSANPEKEKQDITWFHLDDNSWAPFKKDEILSDSTNGLLTTGIIKFSVPKEASLKNTILDPDYHWIMGVVPENTDAICDLMEVFAQSGTASFKDNKNDPGFLAKPLTAKTISKLKVKEAEIKSISQPYASFGGKVKETDHEFYRRVSERLRHKARGISIWDYERIILQEFPEVYKAKCISHSTYDLKDEKDNVHDYEFAPGYVSVIVVPELKNLNAVDPLRPRLSLDTLSKIKKFLSRYISPFAAEKLKVINSLFEKIQVQFYVEFHTGYDRGYYEKELVKDIIRYLSPWAFQEGKDIVFGGKIHRSVILNFIEERPYVDFVTDFKMDHIIDNKNTESDIEEAYASTARSILVSSDKHIILQTTTCS